MHYEVIGSLVEQVFLDVLLPHLAYGFDTRFFFLLQDASRDLVLIVNLVKPAHILGTIRALSMMGVICLLNTE